VAVIIVVVVVVVVVMGSGGGCGAISEAQFVKFGCVVKNMTGKIKGWVTSGASSNVLCMYVCMYVRVCMCV
jgi:hypothetical protein